jgi:mannose-6-phosphate isomerase-like protein (cupin superfamily)
MTAIAGSIVRAQDQGERRWFFGGGVHIWKATADETAGAFLLFEDRMTQGKVTPLHTHPDSDESMFVLEGEILMHIDGTEHRIGAGGLAVAGRGVPHAFMVTSPEVRLLCLHTPGCCQPFYWDASEPLSDGDVGAGVDMARVRASAEKNGGIEILGPPPFSAQRNGTVTD